jgi:hypothetical protein
MDLKWRTLKIVLHSLYYGGGKRRACVAPGKEILTRIEVGMTKLFESGHGGPPKLMVAEKRFYPVDRCGCCCLVRKG